MESLPETAREPLESIREIGGDGNTSSSPPSKKQPLQLKSWFFTYNNYSEVDLDSIFNTLKNFKKMLRFRFQEERGETTGTQHLQGVVELKSAARWSEFKLPPEIHWEKTRNLSSAFSYCCKEETRNGRMFEYGFPKPLKIITNLYPWQQMCLDKSLEEPDDRSLFWIWSHEGGPGKTSFAKYMVHHHNAQVCSGGRESDIVNLIFNTDMDKCTCIIFILPRAAGNRLSYSALEAVKDGLISNTKYETGSKLFNPPHVFIFANQPPARENISEDKWIVRTVAELAEKGLSNLPCFEENVVHPDQS